MKTHRYLTTLALFLIVGCTLEPFSQRVTIQLKVDEKSPSGSLSHSRGPSPSTVSGMDCFFIDASGDGIAPSPLGPDNGIPTACLALGTMSAPVSYAELLAGNSKVKLKGAGTYRFRVYGVTTGSGCAGINSIEALLANTGLEIYQVGETTGTIGNENRTINITNAYPGGSAANLLTCNPAPTVSGITPSTANWRGGASVGISGTGFLAGGRVKIGGKDCTSFFVANSTNISCAVGRRLPGENLDVVVSNPRSAFGTYTGFSYRSFLYVGMYGMFEGYLLNPSTGALSALAGSPYSLSAPNPTYNMVISPNGRNLYTTNQSTTPIPLKYFTLDPNTGIPGSLSTFSGPSGATGNRVLYMHSSGESLYTTDDFAGGFIYQMMISGGVPSNIGTGIQSATSSATAITAIDDFIFTGQTNEIGRWSRAASGALTQLTSHSVSGLGTVRFMIRHPTLRVLYFGDANSKIYKADVDSNGNLTVGAGLSLVGVPQRAVYHSALRKLYVSLAPGGPDILKLSVATDGTLAVESSFTATGSTKDFLDLALDPSENFLYAADHGSPTRVVSCSISATGELTQLSDTSTSQITDSLVVN